MTAHYNAYFIANEHIKTIERSLYENYTWDYDEILPIHIPFDTTTTSAFKKQLEDCIHKSSLAIQSHPGSNWEYPSYILVGKARYYNSDNIDAINTYKYVNTKSEDENVKHEALAELLHVYVDNEDLHSANEVKNVLLQEKLNKKNKVLTHLNIAYMNEKMGERDKMFENLTTSEKYITQKELKAKTNYIIAQLSQQSGNYTDAIKHYGKVIKLNPRYELEFYAKLFRNQLKNKVLRKNDDPKSLRKRFYKILNDEKNIQFKGKIYYELGVFELNNNRLDEAVNNFKKSAANSFNNNKQRGLAYYKIAQLHYHPIKNFPLAKNYYDSTLFAIDSTFKNYSEIKKTHGVLKEFVENLTLIKNNDSLIQLSKLDNERLKRYTMNAIQKEQLALQQKSIAKKKRKKEKRKNNNDPSSNINLVSANSSWYFSNPIEISTGQNEFRSRWGDRPLEDNWRRSLRGDKIIFDIQPKNEKNNSSDTLPTIDYEAEVARRMKNIPTSKEQIIALLKQSETAYYKLGKVYRFGLAENDNSISTFETLFEKFPNSQYIPEVLYQLYILYHQKGDPVKSEEYKNLLLEKYPNSLYAKLIINPHYKEDSYAVSQLLKRVYKKLYDLYEKSNYTEVIFEIENLLKKYPKNDFSDNIKLLEILCMGRLQGGKKYQYELQNFIETYPKSELITYADSMLHRANELQKDKYSSMKVTYVHDTENKHYFMLSFPQKERTHKLLTASFGRILKTFENPVLTAGSIVLDVDFSLFLINDFKNEKDAEIFYDYAMKEKEVVNILKDKKINSFIISQKNFDLLYDSKDLKAYIQFFKKSKNK